MSDRLPVVDQTPVVARVEPPQSALVDCYVARRDGDGPIFYDLVGFGVLAHLNHYAVVPIELYRTICEAAGVDTANLPERS